MADPFSIVAGALGVADVCLRIVDRVRERRHELASIDGELENLVHDVDSLRELCSLIRKTFDEISTSSWTAASSPNSPTLYGSKAGSVVGPSAANLWDHLTQIIKNCHSVLTKLDATVKDICGPPGQNQSGFRAAYGKVSRKKSREDELRQYRSQLEMHQNGLQLVLTIIILHDTRSGQDQNTRSFDDLTTDLKSLDQNLQTQLASIQDATDDHHYDAAAVNVLKDLHASIGSAAEAIKAVSINQHFYTPQSVSSIFTGRETLLQDLRDMFIPPPGIVRGQQRRFIIHGLGGSGKTQFSCKFAEDNRDSFWGVFWVDASSEERIQQTFGDIAKIAGLEKNAASALHWLANLERRWLLIIDNADDIAVDKYFPKGNGGNILVTTRNPAYRLHGNVGPGYYDFGGLDFGEATSLLLKASGHQRPWDKTSEAMASNISQALGFLALAIIHAGAAIRDKLCNLKDYLEFYGRSWQRIRNANSGRNFAAANEDIIYATWEICYKRLESRNTEATNDAIQLLKTFAFFHWENISVEILTRALHNAEREAVQQEEEARAESSNTALKRPSTWSDWARSRAISISTFILRNRGLPTLPSVIRDGRKPGCADDAIFRIRSALKELEQMSLIIFNENDKTYIIHPIVHTWARERFVLADQILWGEIAGRVLAASVLIPPLGDGPEQEAFHLSLLPHIRHVQACRKAIAKKMRKKPGSWPTVAPTLDTDRVRMSMKFSVVYATSGEWASAEPHLTEVQGFLHRYAGPEDARTRRVALFLSDVYWHLGRAPDAQRLQRAVLETCIECLGPDHPDTLRAMSKLGQTLWQQGEYTAARALQEPAMHGLREQLGADHADTLDVMDHLGRTRIKFWQQHDFEEAHRLHELAVAGMERAHGPDHERTLFAKENMGRAAVLLGGRAVQTAPALMEQVLTTRRERLGKEHPYTLLAMANAAIVKSAVGDHHEAEALLTAGLPVANRTLGPDHIGTLFGRHTLACVLVEQKRYADAVSLLVDVTERQKSMPAHRGSYHPDRLGALIELARCYYLLGDLERSVEVCDEAIRGFDAITDKSHPLAVSMRQARSKLGDLVAGVAHESIHVAFPPVLYRVTST